MALIGRALLILALMTAVYGVGASIYGARTRDEDWVASGRRAMYAIFGLALIGFVLMEVAFQRNEFSWVVVAGHSSTTTPTFYKLAAPWSSQQGLTAAVGLPAVDVVQHRAVRHPQADPGDRRVREPPCCSASPGSSRC